MDAKRLQELSEVIQSSNINFLFGAGVSTPFLPLLGNIERALNIAVDDNAREEQYKNYFKEVMLPNKEIISNTLSGNENYLKTKEAYNNFLQALSNLILQRKSAILSKQVNLFTTNIDILLETGHEELQVEYNDGFSGKFNPTFSLANYKKSIYQRSLHFDHCSEIPVFNIIKLHGSLTWKYHELNEKITFSHILDHFDGSLLEKKGSDFLRNYKKILVVNPEETKHLESVLNVYYSELLRMYSSELEKENSTLFVLGFSMDDKHIKEITLRAAKSNPTLRIFVYCSRESNDTMAKKMEITQHPNIQIFNPKSSGNNYTLEYLTENLLKKIDSKNEKRDA